MPSIVVERDAAAVFDAAAHRMTELIEAAVKWRGSCLIGLSYRNECAGVFDVLASNSVDWSRVGVGQTDEDLESATPRPQWNALDTLLLDPAAVPSENRLPMLNEASPDQIDTQLDAYGEILDQRCREMFSLDVAQLMLGPSGSVGALQSNDPILDSTRHLDVSNGPETTVARAGMTFAALQRSRTIVIIALDEESAESVHHLVELDGREPASQIRHRRIEIFADQSAASFLALS